MGALYISIPGLRGVMLLGAIHLPHRPAYHSRPLNPVISTTEIGGGGGGGVVYHVLLHFLRIHIPVTWNEIKINLPFCFLD